jgi:hypothetical protein
MFDYEVHLGLYIIPQQTEMNQFFRTSYTLLSFTLPCDFLLLLFTHFHQFLHLTSGRRYRLRYGPGIPATANSTHTSVRVPRDGHAPRDMNATAEDRARPRLRRTRTSKMRASRTRDFGARSSKHRDSAFCNIWSYDVERHHPIFLTSKPCAPPSTVCRMGIDSIKTWQQYRLHIKRGIYGSIQVKLQSLQTPNMHIAI